MPPRNVYAQYENNKIATASPAELTLMLYEGAIKFCNIALVAIEKQDIEKAHVNITKADRIIEEFQITLNHKYPISEEFDKVYAHIRQLLLWGNIKKEAPYIEEALKHLRTMRDTWKEVMKLTKNGTQTDV